MENSTPFDLNEAVRQWRANMSASPAFRPEDLDELESHLRDCVASLQTKGLSAGEAFWVAKSRVGTDNALDCEFGKVNAEQVWLNRALWMVVGSLAIGGLSTFISALVSVTTVAVHETTRQGQLLGPFSLVVYLVTLIGSYFLVWRSGSRSNGVVWQIGGWMRTHPIATIIGVFLIIAFNSASSIGANVLMVKTMPISTYAALLQWRWPALLLPVFFWPLVLAWLLVRTARKSVIQRKCC